MRAMKHRLRQRNHTSLSSTFRTNIAPVGFPRRDHRGLSPPETEAVSMLLEQARLPQPVANRRTNWRINWPINCVIKKTPWSRRYGSGVIAGVFVVIAGSVALMCLAEALLRIPDKATRTR